MKDNKLIWIRCSGCGYRRKAYREGNVGYNHEHWNYITGGYAPNVEDKIKKSSICANCKGIIHLSDNGEWFHEIPAETKWDDIEGEVECQGFNPPVATP